MLITRYELLSIIALPLGIGFTLQGGLDGARLENRRALMKDLDRMRRRIDLSGGMKGIDKFHDRAFQILASSETAGAFDLSKEDDRLRDRYGRHLWGQSCLLARRLAERGTAVTTVSINTPKTGQEFTNWDDHILNAGRPGHFGKYMEIRLPYMD